VMAPDADAIGYQVIRRHVIRCCHERRLPGRNEPGPPVIFRPG
jgi:hypothetical protein